MNELLGVVRSKDKVIIAILMITLASILALSIGAVTQATIDPHIHTYTSHIEHGKDGNFNFVSVCSDENCENPISTQKILSGIFEDTTAYVAPTCREEGMKRYSFTYEGVTYTLDEKIDKISHKYEGVAVLNDGKMSAVASCIYDGCTKDDIVIDAMPEIEPVSVVNATCHSPRIETYTFNYEGESVTIISTTEEEVAHTLNGVYVTEFQNEDGSYKYGTEGLVIAGTPVLLCGQRTSGYYTCEECNKSNVVIVSKDDHNYVCNDNDIVRPNGTTDGSAYVRCTNDECTDVITLTLPKVVEGNEGVTLIEANHLGKYKKFAYHFENAEYGIVIEFEIDLVWDTHEYVYALAKAPSYSSMGELVITCAYADEGCTFSRTINISKIEIGKNAEVVCEATEATPHIVHYYLKTELYGNYDFDISIGEKLDHEYHYTFERDKNGFVMIGNCNQPDCKKPVTYDRNLKVDYVDTSTCYSLGQHIWTCVYKGETYTIVEAATELKPHNMAYIANETVKPDFDKVGYAYIRCLNDGCTKNEKLELPKLVIDSNAFHIGTDPNTGVKTIIYTFKFPSTYNFEPITIYYYVNAHVHNYKYELEPANGAFDLVGRCSGWDCDQLENRIVDVEVSSMNTSTCTQLGESIWIHFMDDGTSYSFTLPSFEYADHDYIFVESELVIPDFDNEGMLVCICANEECTYSSTHVLPKVSVENTKSVGYDSVTKTRTLKYTYTYGTMVYEFEFTMFDDHTHEYTTTLEPHAGKFDLISRCNSPYCDSEMRDSAVNAELVEDYYSCVEEGYQVWQYEKDGIVYECTIRINIYGHFMTMTYDEHADTTVIPDFENGGSVLIYCDYCGEEISYVDLPKAQLDVNTFVIEETGEYTKYEYTYVYEGLLIISFDIIITK